MLSVKKGRERMEQIVCNQVTKKYGNKAVVDQVSLTIEKGKIYGLIGRNGAGKTTLLSMMASHNPMTEGSITWNGEEIWENSNALNHICFSREIVMSNSGIISLKVKDYLAAASLYYPHWDKEMARELTQKFEIDTKKRLVKLSKGMLSMVTIIVAMASKADFTFMDEPVAGIDVVMRDYFYKRLLDEYMNTGRTFVISTHIIEEAADIMEEVILLKGGKLLCMENTQELLERAFYISGLAEEVEKITQGLEKHHEEKMGRSLGVTVLLKPGQTLPTGYDITIQPVSLQKLFVALCGIE